MNKYAKTKSNPYKLGTKEWRLWTSASRSGTNATLSMPKSMGGFTKNDYSYAKAGNKTTFDNPKPKPKQGSALPLLGLGALFYFFS